jgi:hypothetical protein
MKVEFTIVVDEILELEMDKTDRANIRRWRSESMGAAEASMKLLAEKVNAELQRTHSRSEVSPIKKPDWA